MARASLSIASALEKRDLEIAYIPILCSAPLLYAHRAGLFEKHGLRVWLRQAPGWSGLKQLLVYGMVDAAHMLTSMPLACTLGIDGKQTDLRLALVQNINGQSLTLAAKHRDLRDAGEMRGFALAVPYRFSMHYYLLCDFLAGHGMNPLQDVSIREVPPPRMPYYMEKGWVDGIFAPEPYGQIAVDRGLGFTYFLSRDRWPGHPCCSLATTQEFIDHCPNTYRAMLASVLEAEHVLHEADSEQRKEIARLIAGKGYLNLPDVPAVEEALAGDCHDGLGERRLVPDRIDFVPYAREEFGVWIVSQMQRWGQLPGRIDYQQTVGAVFRRDIGELGREQGFADSAPAQPAWVPSPAGGEAFDEMLRQPFCAFRERPAAVKRYSLSSEVRSRLSDLVRRMAHMAAGDLDSRVVVTGNDEIGLLEQVVNEAILGARFAREAMAEYSETLERRVQERTARLEREVAERARAEESLRLNESRLEALRQLNQMTDAPLKEITDFALEEGVKLTRSRIGYLAFLNEDESVLTMHSWSQSAMQGCAIIDKPIVYPVVSTGLWGEAVRQRRPVITNDYAAPNPHKKGHPAGHVVVLRHMNLPVFDGSRIVLVAGVGNKEGPYDESDVRQLTLLMQGMWGLLRRKREEEALARRAAELAALNRELEAFAYSVSHDLRAPLRAMSGFSRLLLQDQFDRLDDQGKDYLRRVCAAAQRMGELIDDLLNLSRLTRRPMQCQPVDLSGLALGIAAELQASLSGREVEFVVEPGLSVQGDESLLRIALHQLLENACKFTAQEPQPRIEFGRTEVDGAAVFFVRDNGAGFDMAYADKLFAPFQRLHSVEEFPGSGIGLATVQRIIARHGGRCWAEGAVGQGATFYFTL